MRKLPAGSLARRIPVAILLAVAVYYAGWGGEYSAFEIQRLKGQRADAATALEASRAEVDSLRALQERLDRDPATIEAVARERFGMIREGELLYRFVPVEAEKPPTETRVTARTP
ncbi:MAG: FtsB family cell division protein [Gemmatimonadota bacterium]